MERIYLAGPLFSKAERNYMIRLRDRINSIPGLGAIWPGDLIDSERIVKLEPNDKQKYIFLRCLDGLTTANMVVAVLDGPQVDDGTAWEIGYAWARGTPIIGLMTDFRNGGETYGSSVNCMIECACSNIFKEEDMLLDALGRMINEKQGRKNRK